MVRLRPTPEITFIGASLLKIVALAEWRYHAFSKGMVMSESDASLKPARNQLIAFRSYPLAPGYFHNLVV